MKSLLILFVAGLLALPLQAQDGCSIYYPLRKGTMLEYTSYNKKGKVEGSSISEVESVENTSAGITATIKATIKDDKGGELSASSYQVRCEDGTIILDASSMLDPAMQQNLSTMEVSIDGTELVLPGQLQVGQELPDASVNIKAASSGVNILNMTTTITNRKVLARESVTTPAGTFDCYKVSQDTNVKMLISKSFTSIDFYAEGVGVVRSESYDKKGNLDSYMVLTRFEK
jgi:hypothetical protein